MITKIVDILKSERIIYVIEEEVIIAHTGMFCLFMQLEREKPEADYTILQLWIADGDNSNELNYHEVYDNITDDELTETVQSGLNEVREVNRKIGKLSGKFKEIEEFVNTNDIPLQVVDLLWADLEFETN